MTTHNNSRRVAAQVLDQWLREGDFPDRLLETSEIVDRAFVMEVVYGVTRWRRLLDWVIGQLANRPPDSNVYPFLLVGLYQVLLMDNVAGYAAVHETVNAAREGGATKASGFLNALLRRAGREKDGLVARIKSLPTELRESHPDVLIERWTQRHGAERTAALCRWNNTRPQVVLHPNRLRITMEKYGAVLCDAGITASPHPFSPSAFLVLARGTGVRELPGYADGWFSVRDPSTNIALDLLDPRPDETILDACAAPGGKACGIAERMENQGVLVTADLHEDRLSILRTNLKRLGVTCARVVQIDASDPIALSEQLGPIFDRILLDVPCTNTGVLQRRPDARWRISERKIQKLAGTQRKILDAVQGLLKPGGSLVYSTCSLEPEEGEDLIREWLTDHTDYALSRQVDLFPPESQTDGVYAALLTRRAEDSV